MKTPAEWSEIIIARLRLAPLAGAKPEQARLFLSGLVREIQEDAKIQDKIVGDDIPEKL